MITLAIIGVVAALTIPVLTQKYKEQQISTSTKKALSSISNVVSILASDNKKLYELSSYSDIQNSLKTNLKAISSGSSDCSATDLESETPLDSTYTGCYLETGDNMQFWFPAPGAIEDLGGSEGDYEDCQKNIGNGFDELTTIVNSGSTCTYTVDCSGCGSRAPLTIAKATFCSVNSISDCDSVCKKNNSTYKLVCTISRPGGDPTGPVQPTADNFSSTTPIYIEFDINGQKEPNKYGTDRFYLYIQGNYVRFAG